jgi:quinoprotein glucose dehydrogenase
MLPLALAIAVQITVTPHITTLRGQSGPRLYTTWSQPGGSIEGAQYSALKQIDKTNVHQLALQWFFPAPGPIGRFAFSPLVVDNVMYVVGKDNAVFALDAVTGKEIWRFDTEGTPTNRGFNYWENNESFRSPHHLRVAQLPSGDRCAHWKADRELWHQRPR